VYTIHQVVPSKYKNIIATYKIKAGNGHVMDGRYSKTDLLVVPEGTVLNEDVPAPVEEPEPARKSLRQEGDEYEVDFVHGKRRVKHRGKMRTEYLVRWVGYSAEHDTFEPISNLKNAKQAIADYEQSG